MPHESDYTEAEADAILAEAAKIPVDAETKARLTDRVMAKWDAARASHSPPSTPTGDSNG